MRPRGTPEQRTNPAKETERDLLPPPAQSFDEHRLFLDVDGALAYVLWQRARDVRLWAQFPKPPPRDLFETSTDVVRKLVEAAIAEVPDIAKPLRVLNRLVRFPTSATPRTVSAACILVSDWAESRNRVELAHVYAETAAAADPTSAEAAAVAGSRCLRIPPSPGGTPVEVRAVHWLRRAVRLADKYDDCEWYIRAHIRYGLLLYRLGRYKRARRIYTRAAWKADWAGRDELAAKAHHDLVAIESYVGTYEAAEEHTLRALELYSLRHERIQYLVHDYAFALMRHGYFKPSLQLLDVVWELIPPDNRLIINGTIARVAASLRMRDRFEAAVSQVILLSEICNDGATWAYGHLAEGARCFGEWDRAESYAGRALELAIQRQEPDAIRTAYGILDAITDREKPARERSIPPRVHAAVELCLDRLARLREPAEEAVPTSRVITTAWAP